MWYMFATEKIFQTAWWAHNTHSTFNNTVPFLKQNDIPESYGHAGGSHASLRLSATPVHVALGEAVY